MKNGLVKLGIFASGVIFGSLGTYKYLERKFKSLAQEEIDSVREVYREKKKEFETNTEEDTEEDIQEPIKLKNSDYTKYVKKVNDLSYRCKDDFSDRELDVKYKQKPTSRFDESESEFPYVISPEEFGEIDDYSRVTLTHYSDGVLTDELDQPLDKDEIADLVGIDYATHFGEFEDDSVFIRNDIYKSDYEILADLRPFKAVLERKPHHL